MCSAAVASAFLFFAQPALYLTSVKSSGLLTCAEQPVIACLAWRLQQYGYDRLE
jgi:hypothetical protein